MTQPPQTAAASFYKIAPSNTITFGWNFTSLWVQPTSLTVLAIDSDLGYTYPVGGAQGNGIIPGSATEVAWCPYDYEQTPGVQPLAVATYTLHINDERGPQAIGTPGMFQAYSGLKFALYKPGAATPLSQWNCPDCSSATSLTIHPGLIALVATFTVMFLSGYSLLRRGLMAR